MKHTTAVLCIFFSSLLHAQELFTWSEPASNMATKSFGFRLTNTLMNERAPDKRNYYLLPEIMWGVSKKIMLHAEGFFSNMSNRFAAEGGAIYVKYRFLSNDDVHSHFRMALYGRATYNNSHIHQRAINLNGNNSGYEAGLVATQLLNKIALSAGGSWQHATDNADGNKFYYADADRNALAFNVSLGKLMLPKNYENYNQTNLNLMLELLGQTNLGNGQTYADLAPTAQFIILSKMRVDAGYRFSVIKGLKKNVTNGFLLRLEYNIFNAYK
jgi:hypothetical protein